MRMTTPDFDTIRRDAAADDPETRGRALDALLRLVRRDPGVHAVALALFRAELGDPRSPFAALSAAYLPLGAALFELPWLGAIVIAVLFMKGHFDIDPRETQILDLVALLPPVAGMATGAAAIARGAAKGPAAWVCLVAGFVVCGLLAFSFGWELLHPEPAATLSTVV